MRNLSLLPIMHSLNALRVLPGILAIALTLPLVSLRAAEPEPAHGLAMHGDLKYPVDFSHFDYVNPDAPKGGRVLLSAQGSFDSLNAFITRGTPAAGISTIYDTLMIGSADEAFSQYGLLAESIQVPEDRSWVAFTLRDTARWHDGNPVTIDDVIFTFNTLVKQGAPFYRFYYGSVAEVFQTGARTVRFNFQPGENRELPLILGQLPVLPKHYWKDRDFSKTTLEPPLGSGPYKVDKVDAGRSISYTRVDDYWGSDIPVNRGRNNFDVMRYDYYRDSVIALEAFKAGSFDYRNENSSKAWATGYDIPAVKNGLLVKQRINHKLPAGMQGFVFNTRRDIFKDPLVREALANAFNFEWSNTNLFYGQYTQTRSFFDNSELAATGLPSPEELALLEPYRSQLPDAVFSQQYDPPGGDIKGNLRKQLRHASRLLKLAGWQIEDGKRIHQTTGQELSFEILLVSPLFERIVLPMKKELAKLGVALKVRTVDSAQYQQRLTTFDFDMVVSTFGQSLSPGNEQRDFWGSQAADMEGGRNLIGIKNPVIDALIEKLIAAPNRKALITACRALDRVLQWGHYVIPQWHAPFDRIAYWDMFGQPEITPMRGAQFTAWWIDPTRLADLRSKKKSKRN